MALPRHLIDEVPIVSVFPVDLSFSPSSAEEVVVSESKLWWEKSEVDPIGKETAESWYHRDTSPYMD